MASSSGGFIGLPAKILDGLGNCLEARELPRQGDIGRRLGGPDEARHEFRMTPQDEIELVLRQLR